MRRIVAACAFAGLAGACGRGAPVPTPRSVALVPAAVVPSIASCARRGTYALPQRLPGARQGSAVALAKTGGGKLLAYVADVDSRSIHTVSVDDRRESARTRLEGAPRQLVLMPDGRLVATLSDSTHLVVLEPGSDPSAPLEPLCTREVPVEPWGLALSPDDGKLLVTSGWAGALTVFDAASLASLRVIGLSRDPRSVLVNDDGVAFVSHLVGAQMSVVDLGKPDGPTVIDLSMHKSTPRAQLKDEMALRSGVQGYALAKVEVPASAGGEAGPWRVLAPMVSVDHGDLERPTAVYYGPPFDGVPKEAPVVSVVDPETRQPLSRYLLGASEAAFTRECLLPRAAAARAKGATLLVACYGIDAVLDLDALAVDPFRAERRRWDVPPGPEGVAVDDESGRAVVFSQMGAALTVIDLDHPRADRPTIALDYHPDPALADAARGRLLFYRTDDVRISNDGVACASCHIDGRDDAITWSTPMGPRQTPMLAGRLADTAPYGWEGDKPSIEDYVGNTVTRLGGRGLGPQELADIARFLLVTPPPPQGSGESVLAQRGQQIFYDADQECASCHMGGASTDATVHLFTMRTGDSVPGLGFDTPSLRFVRGTAPYFHDGRYPTLEALLADPASKMGHVERLSALDRSALAAYLRSL
jgi:mono/diheme cytochrome c family protein